MSDTRRAPATVPGPTQPTKARAIATAVTAAMFAAGVVSLLVALQQRHSGGNPDVFAAVGVVLLVAALVPAAVHDLLRRTANQR